MPSQFATIHSIEEHQRVVNADPFVLLYVTGVNCGVCVAVRPKVGELLERYPLITSYELDAHRDRELAAQLSVFTIPAIILYVQGKETIREARYFSFGELEQRIARLVALFIDS